MEEKVLLDVQINEQDALKKYAELTIRVDELREAQKKLADSGLKNSQVYIELDQEIKALNKRAQEYQKTVQQGIKSNHEQEGSLQQLKAQLSLYTQEYNKLSKEEREGDKGAMFQARIVNTTKALNEAEQALLNYHRQVGNYGLVVKGLKKEMSDLVAQLQVMKLQGEENSDTYKQAVARLAELKDAIGDVNEEISNAANDTKSISQLNEGINLLSGSFAAYTSIASYAGRETEEVQEACRKLQIVTVALTAAMQIQQATQKSTNTYALASVLVEKSRIKQLAQSRIATLADAKAKTTNSVATKAITAATAAWNLVLNANPVVLILTGVVALSAAVFGLTRLLDDDARSLRENKKAAEEAAEAYELLSSRTDLAIKKINNSLTDETSKINNDMRQHVLLAKQRGASERELADITIKAQHDILDAELEASMKRQAEYPKLISAKRDEVNAEVAVLRAMKSGDKGYEEQRKKVLELKGSLQDLIAQQKNEVNTQQDIVLKSAELDEQARDKQKEAWKKELDSRTKHEQKMDEEALAIQQKAEEARLKQENASQAELFAAKQKWEADSFELSVEYQRKSLEQQKKAGSITKAEYERQMAEIAAATTSFYASQAIAAKDELLSAYRSVMNEVGEVVEKQIGIIDKNLADNLKAVGSQLGIDEDAISKFEYIQELMENHSGPMGADMDELTEEQTAWYKSMEEKMFEYYRVSQELDRQAEEAKTAIEMEEVDKRLGRVFQAIEDENALELLDYSKTEEEKNKIQIAATQKRLDALREEEEKATDPKVRLELQKQIAEGEENIHTLMLDNMQLEADKALANANLTAKQKYEIELDYLQKRLEAVRGNADAEMEVEREIAELQKQRNLEKIAAAEEYANTTMDIAGKMSEMMAGIEQRKLDDFKDGQDEQKDALDKRLKDGLISQEEYDKQVADLDAELEKKQKEIELKQAKREKAISIMQTIINTAMGIAKAVAENPMGGGLPGSAIMAAVGAAQLAAIVAQPLPKASRGMLLRGPSHAAGGIPIEAEGGEAIINKKATSRYLPLLSAINESTGGVSLYSRGGMVSRSRDEMAMGIDYGKLAAACAQMNVQVAVTDINNGQSNMAKVVNRSRY